MDVRPPLALGPEFGRSCIVKNKRASTSVQADTHPPPASSLVLKSSKSGVRSSESVKEPKGLEPSFLLRRTRAEPVHRHYNLIERHQHLVAEMFMFYHLLLFKNDQSWCVFCHTRNPNQYLEQVGLQSSMLKAWISQQAPPISSLY